MAGRSVVVALAALVGVAAVALGFRQIALSPSSNDCDAPFAEPLDPASSQHLLPGANGTYSSSAPTSGAHRLGEYKTGNLDYFIPRPVQVTMLEAGQVLIQYHGLTSDEVDRLRAFTRQHKGVTSAHAGRNPEANIVVTAWQYKMKCGSVDLDGIGDFVDAHLDQAQTH